MAIEKVMAGNCILMGDDTDLLVLLIHHFYQIRTETTHDLFVLRLSSNTVVNIRILLDNLPNTVIENILLIHAVSGCDTVSAMAGIGKTKLLKLLIKNPELILSMDLNCFYDEVIDIERIYKSGLALFCKLYDPTGKNTTFEDLRLRLVKYRI